MPDLSFADVEAKLREAGKEKQALGESLRHQRAADKETLVLNWRALAEAFVYANTDLDAVDDPLAYNHAVMILAGAYRETVQQAIAECEVAFLEERRAGQR